MNDLEKWCAEFRALVPTDENSITPNEATFHCLQGVSFLIDRMVNVGYKDLLGTGNDDVNKQEKESSWCDVNELCRRHPELRRSNVVSRQWRIENNFPCKSGYKCRQIYNDEDVKEWINQHMRGKKC